MQIHGKNIIGRDALNSGEKTFRAHDPRSGQALDPVFYEATEAEADRALNLAETAAMEMRTFQADRMFGFLMAVQEEISAIGDSLIECAARETGLDEARLKGERTRTLNQIKLFADLVKEGSWVDARIDTAQPERKPLPRPDIRRMLEPIGPVAVFGASNFPLAFSVAGGDTVSALAARNPVVVKAHPAHPATSELVASAIARVVRRTSMPEGTFSMLHGRTPEVSVALVTHPKTRAAGFTGSERAGRALFDAAARRPEPIPVYAEMGSVNPVFVLPQALKAGAQTLAEGLFRSVTLGVGQFCTSPGLVFGVEDESFREFRQKLAGMFEQAVPGTMLNAAIAKGFADSFRKAAGIRGVETHASRRESDAQRTEGQPGVMLTDSTTWSRSKELHEEIFGPSTVVVHCGSEADLLTAAEALPGSLTATIHGTPEELRDYSSADSGSQP